MRAYCPTIQIINDAEQDLNPVLALMRTLLARDLQADFMLPMTSLWTCPLSQFSNHFTVCSSSPKSVILWESYIR